MKDEKQDKDFIKLKYYDKEEESIVQLALEKMKKGEKLSEGEIKMIFEHFPNLPKEEEFQKMSDTFSKIAESVVETQMKIVNSIDFSRSPKSN